MSDFSEYYEARQIVAEILRKDLVGPVKNDEILSESPLSYYLCGKLYPQGMDDDSELTEQGSEAEDLENSYDSPLVLSSQRRQSSMGITFLLNGESPSCEMTVEYATYLPIPEEEAKARGLSGQFLPNQSSKRTTTYLQRVEHSHVIEWEASTGSKRFSLSDGAHLDVRSRRVGGKSGCTLMAVSLINTNHSVENKLENAKLAFFQARITARVIDQLSSFAPMDSSLPASCDKELAELEMLYWRSRPYAHGHGCSADWDRHNSAPRWIRTESLPAYEVLQMRPRELDENERFSMSYLATASKEEVVSSLSDFVFEYEKWIDEQEKLIKTVPQKHREIAVGNIQNCRECAKRMLRALDTLSLGGKPFEAFRLANEAMLLQRVNSLRSKDVDVDEKDIRWYPFQLGFFLMQIRSIADPQCSEREIADLLWFPTGGGKTEAYLGVAAYAIFMRRLTGGGDGVAVIMRYTLRLLTLQQFERAAALIAACEHIRRRKGLPGGEISIGMYVGDKLTPNSLEKAAEIIKSAKNGRPPREGQPDPFQVRKCPWCGTALRPEEDYEIILHEKKMLARCPNDSCEFHEGIPASVIDEQIYSNQPTFIVATVDKFAQLPLNEEAGKILGVGTENPGPSLIIQDELHLISGPLGTMVGAYETAIEALCSFGSAAKPKILTSTATARSSSRQLLSLYGKRSAQFPPQGIDIRDSFFAIETTPQEKPGRLYLGVMGSDAAITTVATRTAAALLFATRYLEARGFSERVVDSYWTIVEYFNTLRELGGSLTSLQESVQNLFAFLASTKFSDTYPGVDPDRRYRYVLELTSRRSSAEITRSLQDLEQRHAKYVKDDAIDFAMATNMLSVGVDVGRLNVMVVYGQPKVNSEYIQATSRVGRSTPGIVVSLLNAKRSRDRSHYEQFVGFHQSIYKHVESSTLTPFSDRARDRSLHTIFVTLCRYTLPNMAKNEAADQFRADNNGVDEIKKMIVEHVKKVEPDEAAGTARELDLIAIEWEERTGDGLTYFTKGKPSLSLFKDDLENDRFRAMNSMRSVEPSVHLFEDR